MPEILPDNSSSKKRIECLCVITNKSFATLALKDGTKYASTIRLKPSPALKTNNIMASEIKYFVRVKPISG